MTSEQFEFLCNLLVVISGVCVAAQGFYAGQRAA